MMQKVKVKYLQVDDAHFFVSGDEKSLGLCVAHQDLATAFYAVSPTLNKLVKENYGEEVDYQPELSLEQFQSLLEVNEMPALGEAAPESHMAFPWHEAEAA